MSGIEIVTKYTVLPTGMELDDVELHNFALSVEWKGPRTDTGRGGYAVTDRFEQLSRAGNWGRPQPFQQHQYRWDTLEEALAAARAQVDSVSVNGRTWAEWKAFFQQKSGIAP